MHHSKFLTWLITGILFANSLCAQPVPGSILDRAPVPGSGLYELYLNPDRTVARVIVLQSCGSRRQDQEAAAMLKTWKFTKTPASINKIKVPMTFRIR